jgi:hypothetical protein
VQGAVVNFAVKSGGGTLDRYTAETGVLGYAYFLWTLGSTAGTQTVEASTAGASPVTFTATATAPPSQPQVVLSIISGNNQAGPVGQTLPAWSGVEVRDGNGALLQGVLVTFAVTGGGGTLDRYQAVTGALGRVYFKWTLGPTVGTQTVAASAAGAQPVTFTATAY